MSQNFLWRVGTCACLLACVQSATIQAQESTSSGLPAGSPLAVAPKSAQEHLDAALLMMQLARPNLARFHLQQILDMNPSQEDLLTLRDDNETSTFLSLANSAELNPVADELLNRIINAVEEYQGRDGYVHTLLTELSGTERTRAHALLQLQHLGAQAAPEIIKQLSSQSSFDRELLLQTIVQIGSPMIEPLIGAIHAPDDSVRGIAIQALGLVGGKSEAVWLWAPAFSPDQPTGIQVSARRSLAQILYQNGDLVQRVSSDGATAEILSTATQHLSGRYRWPASDEDDQSLSVWTWNHANGTVEEFRTSRHHASLFYAEGLARDAAELAPQNEQAPVLLLASLLAQEVERSGWGAPIPVGPETAHDLAVRSGAEICLNVLQFSLENKVPAAALSSLSALSLNGSRSLLRNRNSPVVAALDAPSARIQFAAAVTILRWEPTEAFRGSRRIVEILARALHGNSQASTVVMDPNIQRGSHVGSLLKELGYQASLTKTGMEGFEFAASHGDVQLAVLHPNVIRWELSQTIANLRADSRTAHIPVAIYGPEGLRDSLNWLSQEFQNVAYFSETQNSNDLVSRLAELIDQGETPALTQEQRNEQIREAAFWLRRIAIRNAKPIFDLAPAENALIHAVNEPDVAEDALIALTAIGRASVQSEFVQVMASSTYAPEVREQAGLQLGYHIQQHGNLLSQSERDQLVRAWNSESDPHLRTAIAGVIGALRPAPEAVRKEILATPPSAAPVISGEAASDEESIEEESF